MTLTVYDSLCRETSRPFRFPGSAAQWDGLTRMTDLRKLVHHLPWDATTPAANQAFNVVSGGVFRWSWSGVSIARWFGLEPASFDGTIRPDEMQMAGNGDAWRAPGERHGFFETDLDCLTSPWHTDVDLGRPIEVVSDISKS